MSVKRNVVEITAPAAGATVASPVTVSGTSSANLTVTVTVRPQAKTQTVTASGAGVWSTAGFTLAAGRTTATAQGGTSATSTTNFTVA